ncbi:hypothetical protein O0L34_g6509 [Tuta absoluta]|nr:hypothetical protein O0L34_g6509 [Tuta absoluta]
MFRALIKLSVKRILNTNVTKLCSAKPGKTSPPLAKLCSSKPDKACPPNTPFCPPHCCPYWPCYPCCPYYPLGNGYPCYVPCYPSTPWCMNPYKPCRPPCIPIPPPYHPCIPPCSPNPAPCQPCNPPCQPCNPPSQPCNPPCQPCNPPCQPCNPPCQPCNPPCQPCNPPCPPCPRPCCACKPTCSPSTPSPQRYPSSRWNPCTPPCPPRPCRPIPPNPCCPVLPHGDHKPFKHLFFFICLPLIFIQIVRSLFGEHSCHDGEPCRKFEYMRRRTKRFPWGSGQESFFHNPCVNPLPKDCTDQIQMQECENYYKSKRVVDDLLVDMPRCNSKCS